MATPFWRLMASTRQGRSVFGGLQAAVALEAMRTLVPDAPLKTLQCTFVAPAPLRVVTWLIGCIMRPASSMGRRRIESRRGRTS